MRTTGGRSTRSLQPSGGWAKRWSRMHRQLDEGGEVVNRAGVVKLVSTNPATGEEIWSGETGDPLTEVGAARSAWPAWAAHSHAYRIESVRRFANVVRAKETEFAELISKETGKPF